MRKLLNVFDDIWSQAEARNKTESNRFLRLFQQKKRYMHLGIYDSVTKKYVVFDTINLVGNYRYADVKEPPEFAEMRNLVK